MKNFSHLHENKRYLIQQIYGEIKVRWRHLVFLLQPILITFHAHYKFFASKFMSKLNSQLQSVETIPHLNSS